MGKLILSIAAAILVGGCATREGIVEKHPEWPESVRAAIMKGEVKIGMTNEQVDASWGNSRYDSTSTETENSYTVTVFFKNEDTIQTPWKDCPPGRWAVRFEARRLANGKVDLVATMITRL